MAKPTDTFSVLITRRLCLRRIEPRDITGLQACFGDFELMRFWNFAASTTLEETKKVVQWLGKTTSHYDHLAWTVANRSDNQCIGMVTYHHREARNKRLEIGFIVAQKHQRKGFGAEAVRTLIDHCVETLGVHRIEALIHPDNVASIRLVERLGFRCEGGPLTDYLCVGNKFLSVMVYPLLRDRG